MPSRSSEAGTAPRLVGSHLPDVAKAMSGPDRQNVIFNPGYHVVIRGAVALCEGGEATASMGSSEIRPYQDFAPAGDLSSRILAIAEYPDPHRRGFK